MKSLKASGRAVFVFERPVHKEECERLLQGDSQLKEDANIPPYHSSGSSVRIA